MSTNRENSMGPVSRDLAEQVKQRRVWHRPVLSVARIRDASSTTTGSDDCNCGSLQS